MLGIRQSCWLRIPVLRHQLEELKLGKIRLTIPLTAGMKDLLFVIVITMLKQCSSDARVLFSRSVGAIGCLELDYLAHGIANPSGL